MEKSDFRSFLLPLLGISLAGAVLRLQGLAAQPLLPDEMQVAVSAGNYMDHGHFGPTMWYHPNLRNIVIYAVGKLSGYGPYALRGMSLLAGILGVFIAGALLRVLTGNRPAALAAACFLAIDPVHITFSRQAIQETWTIFFILLGVLLAVLYRDRNRPWMMIAAGIVFGLGMASKFHAVFPLMVILFSGIAGAWRARSVPRGVFLFSCLVLLPAAVYLLTYLPWFGRGYDMGEWLRMQAVLFNKMTTHAGNPMDQVIDTRAWQWFLRPMGYAGFVHAQGRPFVTIAFSNPVVWLLVLPATVYVMREIIRSRYAGYEREGLILLLVLFIVSYTPLALSPRPIWLLSSLAVLPFGMMIVAVAIMEWSRANAWGKNALRGYAAIVLLTSLALYPMAVGKAKEYRYLAPLVERFRPPFERGRYPRIERGVEAGERGTHMRRSLPNP